MTELAHPLDIEFAITLSYCVVRPSEVKRRVAGWEEDDAQCTTSGFVIETEGGGYAYIVSARFVADRAIKTLTQRFDEEPIHLYERERIWYRWPLQGGKDTGLAVAKSTAQWK